MILPSDSTHTRILSALMARIAERQAVYQQTKALLREITRREELMK